jgi:hypothetical protein
VVQELHVVSSELGGTPFCGSLVNAPTAAPSSSADGGSGLGAGEQAGVRTPLCYQRAGLPDADACRSSFEGLQYSVRPHHLCESLFFGYEGV